MGLLPKSLLMYTLPLARLANINCLGEAVLREGDLFEKREPKRTNELSPFLSVLLATNNSGKVG